jgi:hypothetical protein
MGGIKDLNDYSPPISFQVSNVIDIFVTSNIIPIQTHTELLNVEWVLNIKNKLSILLNLSNWKSAKIRKIKFISQHN